MSGRKLNWKSLIRLVAVFAIVFGVLVLAESRVAWAQTEHIVNVLHGDASPWEDIEVMVFVQTGPDPDEELDWSVDWDVTDANGKVYFDLIENATATRWYYVIGEGYFGGDPVEDWVNYPTKFKQCRAAPGW